MYKTILFILTASVAALATLNSLDVKPQHFHTDAEVAHYEKFLNNDTSLIGGHNELFAASAECEGCHGHDPLGTASLTEDGIDINVVDDWKATMMANSAKDPFWRAKVSHEAILNPGIQAELESSCTDCHAPLGFYNAMHLGMPHYTMDDLKMDSVALDGVSCVACHQISPDSVGLTFSGIDIKYVEDTLYGPYDDPFAGPMQFVGYTPVYSDHIQTSEVCASCHTLITETIGLDGVPNGSEFVEQATYHEWLNSQYNSDGDNNMECQSCHMTRVDDNVVISANYLFLPPRSPFFKHDIVGGNTFMLEMMNEHSDTLDIRASDTNYNEAIAASYDMLQNHSVDLAVTQIARDADSLFIEVELTNKAGHKFPSAYPSRIAFVQLLAITEEGDSIFQSGAVAEDYEVVDRDFPYERHYDVIRSPEQVQVYELVMGDETGAETTVLSQAEAPLKDNRLAPFGFTDTHFTYDTVAYVGDVLSDDDFNKDMVGQQGTGKDVIAYHIPIMEYAGSIELQARVFYQVTPPRWLASMFDHESEDIDLFRYMYDLADNTPVTVASMLSIVDGIDESQVPEDEIIVFPNPTKTGEIALSNRSGHSIDAYEVYDASGKLLRSEQVRGNTIYTVLPEVSGLYFVKVMSRDQSRLFKIFRY